MKQFWFKVHKFLYPNWNWIIVAVLLGGTLQFITFYKSMTETPLAYVSYVLSAYALTVVCLFLAKNLNGKLKILVHQNEHVHRYLTDAPFKTHMSLYFSLVLNLIFAAIKLAYGIRYCSVWFGTLAVYYIMLSLLRFLLLHSVMQNGIGAKLITEYRRCRLCGIILLLMNIVLTGEVILMVGENAGFSYPGYLIYVVALYAFYNIITAVRDVIKYRKYRSPVMAAAKTVKLATALVSMLALTTAMLTQFNTRGPQFQRMMIGVTGGCVSFLVLLIAVLMIVKSTKSLDAMRQENATK